MLKKSRPAAKKKVNYGRRAKATRISSPTRDSVALPDGDEFPDTLDLKAQPLETSVESPLVDDDDDEDYALSPPAPKPKPKSKVAPKRKPGPAGKSAPLENLKATTVKSKAKTQTRTRARVTATKVKDADDKQTVKADPPRKAKKKPEVVSTDEGEDEEREGGTTKVELTKDSPVLVEVSSSPPEPPNPIHKSASRVKSQEVLCFSFRSRFSYRCVNPFRTRNVRNTHQKLTIVQQLVPH